MDQYSDNGVRVEYEVHFQRDRRARKVVRSGPPPEKAPDALPRIARLLTLAHKWEGMVRRAEAKDYTEIARRMGLTKVRVSQVLGLTLLAPDLQDRLLLAPGEAHARPIPEHRLRDVSGEPRWTAQRRILALRDPAWPPTSA